MSRATHDRSGTYHLGSTPDYGVELAADIDTLPAGANLRDVLIALQAAVVDLENRFRANAVLLRTQTGSRTADSVFRRSTSSTILADAVTKKTSNGSITADALRLLSVAGSIVGDAELVSATTFHFAADATVLRINAGSLTADVVVLAGQASSFTADARIDYGFTADAYITSGGDEALAYQFFDDPMWFDSYSDETLVGQKPMRS